MAVKAIVGKTSTFVLSFALPAFSNVAYGKNLARYFCKIGLYMFFLTGGNSGEKKEASAASFW